MNRTVSTVFFSFSTFLLLVCLHAFPLFAQVADEPNTFRLAQTYEQAGKYEQALRYYQDLYTFRPDNSSYFDGVRRCLTLLKRYDEVIALITARLNRYPQDTQLYVVRGGTWLRMGNEDKAFSDWDEALKKAPYDSQVYVWIAEEAINNRRYETAVDYLLRGRKALKSPQLFIFEVARAYAMNMKFDAAMNEYIQYVLAAPTSVWQIQQYIAQFSDIPEALTSAQKMTRKAANDNGSNIAVRQLLAWLYMEEKNYSEAYEVYREIDRLQKSNGIELLQFAQRAYQDKAFHAAEKTYADLKRQYPKATFMPEVFFYHARTIEALSEKNDVPQALRTPSRATDLPSSEAVVSYEGAIAMYEEVIRAFPTHPVASESYYRIAYLKYTRFHDMDGALAILEKQNDNRREATGRVDGYILVGDILIAKGDLDGATEQYEATLELQLLLPEQRDDVRFKIAEIQYFKGDVEKAVEMLEPLMENVSNDITNDALSLSLFIQQYRQPSEEPLKRYAYSQFLERQRKFSEAEAVLRDLIEKHGTSPLLDYAYLRLGNIQLLMRRVEDSERTFIDALKRYPDSILRDRFLFALGRLYEEHMNDGAKAIEAYQRLLNDLPNSIHSGKARERIIDLRKSHL